MGIAEASTSHQRIETDASRSFTPCLAAETLKHSNAARQSHTHSGSRRGSKPRRDQVLSPSWTADSRWTLAVHLGQRV